MTAADVYGTLSHGRKAVLHSMFQQMAGRDYLMDPQGFQEFLKTPGAMQALIGKTGFEPGITPNQAPTNVQTPEMAAQGRMNAKLFEDRVAQLFNTETAPGLRSQGAWLGSEIFGGLPRLMQPQTNQVPVASPGTGLGGQGFIPQANPSITGNPFTDPATGLSVPAPPAASAFGGRTFNTLFGRGGQTRGGFDRLGGTASLSRTLGNLGGRAGFRSR